MDRAGERGGEFSDWDKSGAPSHRSETELNWTASVASAAGQRHRCCDLKGGHQWLNGWLADDHVENPYGTYDPVTDLTS